MEGLPADIIPDRVWSQTRGLFQELSAQEHKQPMFVSQLCAAVEWAKVDLVLSQAAYKPLHAYTQKLHPQTDIEQDQSITGKTEDPRHRSKSLLGWSALVSGHFGLLLQIKSLFRLLS